MMLPLKENQADLGMSRAIYRDNYIILTKHALVNIDQQQ